ncbi:MAG TPA: SpoIIE family protein phosphatase [bacterium]|nr:SpoIIE family protein phosphatase [bacterium]
MSTTRLDIYDFFLRKKGEELCGDKVKIFEDNRKIIIVLSDGLGSGVKANILATLTSEIIVKMLSENIDLEDVIATVISTLPICQTRKIAYATFTILQLDKKTYDFQIVNFDNPPVFFFRKEKLIQIEYTDFVFADKKIKMFQDQLKLDDLLVIISDGVLYAGLGTKLNFGWGWNNIADFIKKKILETQPTSQAIVESLIEQTYKLYNGDIGDDATVISIFNRAKKSIIIFTGPPENEENDFKIVKKLLEFPGRKIVCGGTTGTIVGRYFNKEPEVDISTITREVPPIAYLPGIDLLTEGILTMSKTLEILKKTNFDISQELKKNRNGALLLANEIIMADEINFIVGRKINEYYQNPNLPQNISIRINLIKEFAQVLIDKKKEVSIEYV